MDQSAVGSRVGGVFGPYQLRSLIGKGGMGEVYEAYDTGKDRTVALKLLSEDLARDPSFQERFRRESRAAARLQEPHVIPIHDWGEIDGVLYIDMRLVHGRDLRSALREDGPMSPPRAVAVIGQVAAALDAAHADGLVHRDVKPENILLTADGFAYLVDFGIAHSSSDIQLTTQGSTIGSYAYMAPERFDIGPVDGAADTYSLACVLHECLTGRQPFPRTSVSQLIKSHMLSGPPLPSLKPGVPAGFDGVVARGMAKQPQARYRSTGDLARAAYAALGQTDQSAATAIVDHTAIGKPAAAAATAAIFQQTAIGEPLPPTDHWQQAPASPPSTPPFAGAQYPAAAHTGSQQHSSPRKSPLLPILLTLVAVLVVGLGGMIAWVTTSNKPSANVENSASQDAAGVSATFSAEQTIEVVTETATAPPTMTVTTTVPAPSQRSAPPAIARNVGVAGADGQGFLRMPNARCNDANPAVTVARTTKSYVVICVTGVGRYYYKGVRASDMAAIEIDDPVSTGDGFIATSNDGTKYQLGHVSLRMTNGGTLLAEEPVLEFWSS